MSQPLTIHALHADLETPVSAYLKLRALAPWSFLLESVEGPEHWASYSILGIGARRIFTAADGQLSLREEGKAPVCVAADDPLSTLREALQQQPPSAPPDAPPFVGGIFGFLSYDAVRFFERVPLPDAPSEVPDALFFEPHVLAVFDNRRHSLTLFCHDQAWLDAAIQHMRGPLPRVARSSGSWRPPTACDSSAAFAEMVAQVKAHIRKGDIIQAVPSRRFELPRVAHPFDVYRGLRTINPSPYMYYFETPDLQIAGASPEVMVRVKDGRVTVRPIAGTRPRGATEVRDIALAEELRHDPKETAEHIMLVDLGRNDIGRVAIPGSVVVRDLMVVEHYSHVMHLVSQVEGTLRTDCDAYDALRATFPAGTLSGAPKIRAMEIIAALEKRRRGIYGGAVGYFGPRGDADFGIAIRTLVALPDDLFVVQAGAGIVADSDPAQETRETEDKARAVIRAAEWACRGSDEQHWRV